jgi:hypothetical protein
VWLLEQVVVKEKKEAKLGGEEEFYLSQFLITNSSFSLVTFGAKR